MTLVQSKNNTPIRLTDERWHHIIRRHPEITTQRERILQTIRNPDLIQQGDSGELLAIRFFETTPLTSKYLVVVYREISSNDGFVLTAYLTRRPSSRGTVLWML